MSPPRQFGRTAIALLLASSMISVSGAALAQQAEDDEGGDVIIVTAQKRSQSLQDVPISLQAIGTEALDQRNVSGFTDFTKQLPSVSFQTSGPGSTNVYIRGVASGGDGNHSGSLPSVGVYLDEQPVTTIGGTLDVHVYDIARIEALSGPQGTLYGASSEAGTIRIITNRPDTSKFSGKVDAELNSVRRGGMGGKLEGYVNLPFNEMAALRLVGFYQHDAGYIDNVAGTRTFIGSPKPAGAVGSGTAIVPQATNPDYNTGFVLQNTQFVKDNYNDHEIYGGRAALGVDLDDNWTATGTFMAQVQQTHGSDVSDPSVGDLQVQHFLPEKRTDSWWQGALTIEGKIGNWDLTYSGAYMKRNIDSMTDYTDYAEAYDQLYADYGGLANYFYYQDAAGNTVLPIQGIKGRDKFNKLSQEFRISSPSDSRLRVVGGLFYQRQEHNIRQDYYVNGLGPQVSVNGSPGTLWLTQQIRVDKDYAAFGEASFDILDNLTLTGGLRYYKYDNSLVGFFGFGRNPGVEAGDTRPYTLHPFNGAGSSRTGVAGCFLADGSTLREAYLAGKDTSKLIAPVVAGSPCNNLGIVSNGTVVPKSTEDDGFIHRLNLSWKIDRDHMVYATWSRGFRPGGINRRGSIPPYASDFLTNYEIGWKTSWMGGKLRWNGAIFMADWDKFQYSFLGQNSFTEIHNGPNARIKGIESDITVVPVRGLTLSATAAYYDAKTRQNTCAVDDPTYTCSGANAILAPAGTRLPVTPQFKANGSLRYEFPVGMADAHIQGVATHQSSALSDLRVNLPTALGPIPYLHQYTTFDAAFGFDWSKFSVEAYVTNVFDERAEVSTGVQCGVCYQRPYYYYLPPRTIGLRMGYKF